MNRYKRNRYREADYINLGGKIFPLEDFSGDDVNTVLAKTKAAYEKEMSERERAMKMKDANMILSTLSESPSFEELYEVVSDTDLIDTIGGNILAACNKIIYRFYNDGDFFYKGYGKEVLSGPVMYILNHVEDLEDVFTEAVRDCDNSGKSIENKKYEKHLNIIKDAVVDTLLNENKYLFGEVSVEKYFETPADVEYFDDYRYKNEFTVEFPDSVQEYVDADIIDWDHAKDMLQRMCDALNIDSRKVYHVYGSEFCIEDLVDEDYELIEKELDDWIEGYIDDLKYDYGDPVKEDDEEDSEDDEE